MYTLPDVWIRPTFAGRGRKVSGQLEAHTNGFRYSNPKGETLDIMYRYHTMYAQLSCSSFTAFGTKPAAYY